MNPVTNYCQSVLGENQIAKDTLRFIPEFTDSSDALIDMVFLYSKPIDLKPGEILIQEGLFDQWVYFLLNGHLDVKIGDQSLGSTFGPIVGERCILGEPRGANLVAGADGLLALGVEMTIIDELNRKVNDYRKTAKDEADYLRFAEEKLSVSLELLVIVLSEVLGRIVDIYRTGKKTFDVLKENRPSLNVRLQNLYSFSSGSSSGDLEGTSTPSSLLSSSDPPVNIPIYSFEDFVDIVYFELLQKHLTAYGYNKFPQKIWRQKFTIDQERQVTIWEAYRWLQSAFQLTHSDLIEVSYSVFEIASKYTAASNSAVSSILEISNCEDERSRAMELAASETRTIDPASQQMIITQLFQPFAEKLNSSRDSEQSVETGKMSQADIDALFD